MIRFGCASCGAQFKVSDDKAGKRAKCPRCTTILTIPSPPPPEPQELGEYRLADEDDLPPPAPAQAAASATAAAPKGRAASPEAPPKPTSGRVIRCPSCTQALPAESRICAECGIKLPSGRPVLTSRGVDLDVLEIDADKTIRPLSWLIPTGIYPIYSEAHGRARPWATWAIAAVTVLASAAFWAFDWTGSPRMQSAKNYMLWVGHAPPSQEHLAMFVLGTSYGDQAALKAKMKELRAAEEAKHAPARTNRPRRPEVEDPEEQDVGGFFASMAIAHDKFLLPAHEALEPGRQYVGRYRFSQLLTHAFLHADLLHLAGNLLFLIVLGARVNAAIGNVGTLLLYPLLAMISGWAFKLSSDAGMPLPSLGASGAVMGMAGMYIVLFPIHKIHMVAWWRRGLLLGAGLSKKIFALPGIVVVMFYISFDVIYTILRVPTGVAHWAHLGGLIAGVILAVMLLLTRLAHTGGDGLSLLLGKYAWPLIGTPIAHARRRAG